MIRVSRPWFSGRDTIPPAVAEYRLPPTRGPAFWSISQSDQPHLFSFGPGDDRDRHHTKEPVMTLSEFISHRVVVGALGAGVIAGTLLSSATGIAAADPTP